MVMARYSIGVDFGTESGRAVLVDVDTGEEAATSVIAYPHGVMDHALPDGTPLAHNWALQHPSDYLEVLEQAVPAVLQQRGVLSEQVVGLGIDFTACTMLPVLKDGTPLCAVPALQSRPHAWVKLWKHHAAQDEANRLNEIARKRGEAWLQRYGGKVLSEWLIPKIWQILDEDPEVYRMADRFVEAGDWVVWQLTGALLRNSCMAGYKALYWDKRTGYPSPAFFQALDPRLEYVVAEKLAGHIVPLGTRAGFLTPAMAERIRLHPGVAVAVANLDAHVSVPACGVTAPGKMLMMMGATISHLVLGEKLSQVPGMCGAVEDGILPGFWGYEAGQPAVGDIFGWFVKHGVPASLERETEKHLEVSIHTLLEEQASHLQPGQSGLLALDWWNGNRSVLSDGDLSGLMLGYTLRTEPPEVYRALIEATAFGTRTIIDNFVEHGVPVRELYACGSLPEKNRLLMQIFADVTNRTIQVSASRQTPALGAALFGAVAAGAERGGYNTVDAAAEKMARLKPDFYRPNPEHVTVYEQLYREYRTLHDYFGRGINDVMKRLKALSGKA